MDYETLQIIGSIVGGIAVILGGPKYLILKKTMDALVDGIELQGRAMDRLERKAMKKRIEDQVRFNGSPKLLDKTLDKKKYRYSKQ